MCSIDADDEGEPMSCTASLMKPLGKLASGKDSHQVAGSTISATSKCEERNGARFALKARVDFFSVSRYKPFHFGHLIVLHLFILDGSCKQQNDMVVEPVSHASQLSFYGVQGLGYLKGPSKCPHCQQL